MSIPEHVRRAHHALRLRASAEFVLPRYRLWKEQLAASNKAFDLFAVNL